MVVVVVSHDCDLTQDPTVEAAVEVIVGRQITQSDGNYTYAKNARRLHITFSDGSETITAELRSTGKEDVPKQEIGQFNPSDDVRATPSELVILQRWLASRYRRAAFAEEFDRRLESLGLRTAMSKALKSHGSFISAVYFDLDKGREVKRSGPQDAYQLSIYLLFDTNDDPEAAENAAKTASTSILSAFKKKCCSDAGEWSYIELIECEAVSDRAMTVQQADSLARWSADHMSLRINPAEILRQDD